jgi:hypothetical protein
MTALKKILQKEMISQKIFEDFCNLCDENDILIEDQIEALLDLVIRFQIADQQEFKNCCDRYQTRFLQQLGKINQQKYKKEIN